MPAALKNYLDEHSEIKDIALHLDSDWTGRGAAKALIEVLGKSYRVRDEPPMFGKDYNEELQYLQQEKLKSERRREHER